MPDPRNGFDIPIGRHLLIGFDVRGRFFAFGPAPMMPSDGGEVQMSNSFVGSAALLKLGARFPLSKKEP